MRKLTIARKASNKEWLEVRIATMAKEWVATNNKKESLKDFFYACRRLFPDEIKEALEQKTRRSPIEDLFVDDKVKFKQAEKQRIQAAENRRIAYRLGKVDYSKPGWEREYEAIVGEKPTFKEEAQ